MTSPKPGRRVRGSSTGRPIMALLDLLGRRMTLRILWELREAGLVEHGAEGYGLSPQGGELLERFLPLNAWADEWAKLLAKAHEPAGRRLGRAKR